MTALSNIQRDFIADTAEVEWVRRADECHANVRHTTIEYRNLETEFFLGAAGVLQQLAVMHEQPPQAYIPRHWLTHPIQGRCIVAPYRIRRLSHASLIERATKMLERMIPADRFSSDLALAYIAKADNDDFRDWVKALPQGR